MRPKAKPSVTRQDRSAITTRASMRKWFRRHEVSEKGRPEVSAKTTGADSQGTYEAIIYT